MSDKEEYPTLKLADELDERADNVFILDFGDQWKTTAENRDHCWVIRDWELYSDTDFGTFWRETSAFSIDKKVVNTLYLVDHE